MQARAETPILLEASFTIPYNGRMVPNRTILSWACCLLLANASAWTPPVIISEFMAENKDGLKDAFGNASDWIELQNTTSRPIALSGWSLTDDPTRKGKWVLPDVVLPPWGTRLIWASNANLTDPAGELHTNFALSKNGEYLGLYDADRMLVHDYGTAYPPQYEDLSFGLGLSLSDQTVELVSDATPVRAFSPADGTLASTWQHPAFDDAGWAAGVLPAGYATKNPAWASQISMSLLTLAQGKPGVFLRIPFALSDAASVQSLSLTLTYDDGAAVYLNGGFACGANIASPETLTHASFAASILGDPSTLDAADISPATNRLTCGTNIMAVHVMNCNASSSDLFLKPRLTAVCKSLSTTDAPGFLIGATPGTLNGDASTQRLPQTVAFSHPAGIAASAFTLTLSGNASGQTIRYTTTGADPALTNDLLYTAPFAVASSCHIRARVFDAAGRSGATTTAQYTFCSGDSATLNFSSGLPLLVLRETDPGTNGIPAAESTIDTACSVHLIEPDDGVARLTGPATLTSRAGIHVRGSSSSGFPKKPYSLSFWGEDNDDLKVAIAGFPEGSDFALISCWSYDRTYLHDAFMFTLSRQLGRYAPRTRWVEVFLVQNETNSLSAACYQGLYVLEERIKAGNSRVPVDDVVTPGDTALPALSGSYLFKADRADADEFSWRTARNFPNSSGRYMVLAYPKLADAQPEQRRYIVDAFNAFEDVLYGPDPMNPETGVGVHIDLLSWADFHMLKMFSMDVDIFTLSSWFHKDRGGKIMAGPVWDFDRSLGPYGYAESSFPNVKRWDAWTFASEPFARADLWGKLHAQPAFQRLYWDRWTELRKGPLANASLAATLSGLKNGLPEASATRDYTKWNTWPTNDAFGRTHSGEVAWLTWFATNHASWIDENLYSKCALLRPPTLSPLPGVRPADQPVTVTLTATEGDLLYFTLDGSDPALWNNLPAPQARLCGSGASVQLTHAAALFVRAYSSSSGKWSLAARGDYLVGARPARPGDLLLSEIHYHPHTGSDTALPALTDRSYEFVEIVNVADCAVSLAGCRFPEGEPADALTLTGPILQPGEHAVVARHSEAFARRYGGELRPAAYWLYGSLSDSGDTVTLLNARGLVLDSVTYKTASPWPDAADGGGDSLNRVEFPGGFDSRWDAASPTPGRGGFSEWLGLRGLSTLDGDADGDGVSNLVEYYTGADPQDPSDHGRSDFHGFSVGDEGVRVSYHQASDRPDVWASLQQSDDLLEWYDADDRYLSAEACDDGTLWTLHLPAEILGESPQRYFRLVVWPATSSHSGGTLPPPL